MRIARHKPPVVRLSPKSSLEILLSNSSRVGMFVTGLVAAVFALSTARLILEPITLGVVIGLMLGPIASRLERRGVPAGFSAAAVVLVFLALVAVMALALAAPLSGWLNRLPEIGRQLQFHLNQLQQPLDALKHLRDQLRDAINLAHRHGLLIIGQQIEDAQAAAAMWMGGVDFIQGNLVQSVGKELDFDFQSAVL